MLNNYDSRVRFYTASTRRRNESRNRAAETSKALTLKTPFPKTLFPPRYACDSEMHR